MSEKTTPFTLIYVLLDSSDGSRVSCIGSSRPALSAAALPATTGPLTVPNPVRHYRSYRSYGITDHQICNARSACAHHMLTFSQWTHGIPSAARREGARKAVEPGLPWCWPKSVDLLGLLGMQATAAGMQQQQPKKRNADCRGGRRPATPGAPSLTIG